MSIQYARPGTPRPSRVEILRFPPARILVFLTKPEEFVSVWLHFTGIGSLPCLGDECHYHLGDPFLYHYAAVAVCRRAKLQAANWERAIMPICESNRGLMEEDFRLQALEVYKSENAKAGVLSWRVAQTLKEPLAHSFNLQSHMETFWQIQTAKLQSLRDQHAVRPKS